MRKDLKRNQKTHHLPRGKNQSCCLWFPYPHNNSSKTLWGFIRKDEENRETKMKLVIKKSNEDKVTIDTILEESTPPET